MLDKIFKSNMIMGLVAVATLVLVGLMYYNIQSVNGSNSKQQDNANIQ